MELTEKNKQHIDSLTYEELLFRWRFAVDAYWFRGPTSEYWEQRMNELRDSVDHAAISKRIGWERKTNGEPVKVTRSEAAEIEKQSRERIEIGLQGEVVRDAAVPAMWEEDDDVETLRDKLVFVNEVARLRSGGITEICAELEAVKAENTKLKEQMSIEKKYDDPRLLKGIEKIIPQDLLILLDELWNATVAWICISGSCDDEANRVKSAKLAIADYMQHRAQAEREREAGNESNH